MHGIVLNSPMTPPGVFVVAVCMQSRTMVCLLCSTWSKMRASGGRVWPGELISGSSLPLIAHLQCEALLNAFFFHTWSRMLCQLGIDFVPNKEVSLRPLCRLMDVSVPSTMRAIFWGENFRHECHHDDAYLRTSAGRLHSLACILS